MRTMKLYTGMGASFTPVYMKGRHDSGYTRIVADEGRYVTDGEQIMSCVDVADAYINEWHDCDMPTEPGEEATAEDHRDDRFQISDQLSPLGG